jgi:hypothetical protein
MMVNILDTGTVYTYGSTHPDLAGIVPGWNWHEDSADITAENVHGNLVAGFACGTTNNEIGVASVASGPTTNGNCRMHKVSYDSRGYATTSAIAAGIMGVVRDYPSDRTIISISYQAVGQYISAAANSVFENNNALVIVAAGNQAEYLNYPDDPGTIDVSATDSADVFGSFSGYGPPIDLAAPGVSLQTTLACYTEGCYSDEPSPPWIYGSSSGTSVSTAVVAGVASIVWQANPALCNYQVEQAMEESAVDLGDIGHDNYYGHGRVDAFAAVVRAQNMVPDETCNRSNGGGDDGGNGGGGGDDGDTEPPALAIVSPEDGSTIRGKKINVRANATDNQSGVANVRFEVDGIIVANDASAPYKVQLTNLSSGEHALVVTAVDGAGNASTAELAFSTR